jgi:hypothetical protein
MNSSASSLISRSAMIAASAAAIPELLEDLITSEPAPGLREPVGLAAIVLVSVPKMPSPPSPTEEEKTPDPGLLS